MECPENKANINLQYKEIAIYEQNATGGSPTGGGMESSPSLCGRMTFELVLRYRARVVYVEFALRPPVNSDI